MDFLLTSPFSAISALHVTYGCFDSELRFNFIMKFSWTQKINFDESCHQNKPSLKFFTKIDVAQQKLVVML